MTCSRALVTGLVALMAICTVGSAAADGAASPHVGNVQVVEAPHSAARSRTTLPRSLVQAIHTKLGPGPIGVGVAPLVSGIPAASGAREATASAQSIDARISRTFNGELANDDSAGYAVALSSDGTIALVGAPYASDGIVVGDGAAYVFHASAEGSWTSSSAPTAILTDGSIGEWNFGLSVALSSDGTTALVGSKYGNYYKGAAYVFHVASESSWATSSTPTAMLTNASSSTYSFFGSAVALSSDGTTALIGAPDGITTDICTYGAAYVFHVDSQSSWATTSTPTAMETEANCNDFLGYAVALSSDGTTALIGAGFDEEGVACVFHVSSQSSWTSSSTPTAILTDDRSAADGDEFGYSVALSSDGTTALIGAPEENAYAGAAYVFHVSSEGSWVSSSAPAATLTNGSSADSFDEFGASVATSSNGITAIVGVPEENLDPGGVSGAGAADVFHALSEDSWTTSSTPTAALTNGAGVADNVFGTSVSLSSDGSTAVIGADGPGAAYIFHAAVGSTWTTTSTTTATLDNASKATSKTALKLSAARVTYGDEQVEHLSVTVTDAGTASAVAGTVTIKESATTLCVITLTSGKGTCSLMAKRLAAGTYRLVATYRGTANVDTSASAKETLTVSR
jgi:hypothetical protein